MRSVLYRTVGENENRGSGVAAGPKRFGSADMMVKKKRIRIGASCARTARMEVSPPCAGAAPAVAGRRPPM